MNNKKNSELENPEGEDRQPTPKEIQSLVIRQHKLLDKMKAQVGQLTSINMEQQIIIDELREALNVTTPTVEAPSE